MENFQSLPFITRKMLSFENASTFSILVESRAGNAGGITIRGATREGMFTLQHVTTNDYSLSSEIFSLPDIPIWISALDTNGSQVSGDCYVAISLRINQDRVYQLAAGYVYKIEGVNWPATNIKESSVTKGQLLRVVSSDPAAGSELTLAVPSNTMWRVKAVQFTLVTGAVAASRIIHLQFSIGGSVMYDCISNTAQLISTQREYYCYPNLVGGSAAENTSIIIPIPEGILMKDGDEIATVTTAFNALDNFNTMRVLVEQYVYL